MLKLSIVFVLLAMFGLNSLTYGSPSPLKLMIEVKPVAGQSNHNEKPEEPAPDAEAAKEKADDLAADDEEKSADKKPENPANLNALRQWEWMGYMG